MALPEYIFAAKTMMQLLRLYSGHGEQHMPGDPLLSFSLGYFPWPT
jgi:hypothetical protein